MANQFDGQLIKVYSALAAEIDHRLTAIATMLPGKLSSETEASP
jgi:hypothetical protein